MESFLNFLGTPHGVATGFGVAGVIGYLLFMLDTRREEIRKRCIELASLFSEAGFKRTPRILQDLAVGDKSGALHEAAELYKIFSDPVKREQELADVFANVLRAKLNDPNQVKALKKFVDDAAAAFASGDPLASVSLLQGDLMSAVKASPFGNDLLTHPLVAFPDLSKNPALVAIANKLQEVGMGNLIPHLLPAVAEAPTPSVAK